MGLHLEIVALVVASAIVALLAVGAALAGGSVLVGWDSESRGERQLERERRAVLVEMLTRAVLACQLVSVVAFVAVVDHLHPLFEGAMCAVGTLGAHGLGFPTLLTKLGVFLLCGLWLVLDRSASAVFSVGLVRLKHGSLAFIAVLLGVENVLQIRYFSGLQPDVITSCCATVFNRNGQGIGSELAALPARESQAAFLLCSVVTLVTGLRLLRRGRSPVLFSLSSLILAAVAVGAVLSWIAPGVYELPTHHCPLCLLATPHRSIGYPLYSSLAVALVAGAGVGVVGLARRLDSGGTIRAGEEERLCAASLAGFGVFAALGIAPLLRSGFYPGGI